MKKTKFGNNKGFTLIELVLVLALGMLVVLGGLSYYKGASQTQETSALLEGVTAIQSATRSLSGGTGNYGTGSLNAALINAAKVPATFPATGTSITDPSGNAVTVTGFTTSYTIDLATQTQANCISLLTSSGSFATYKVGAGAATATPATPAAAATACAAATQTVTLAGN